MANDKNEFTFHTVIVIRRKLNILICNHVFSQEEVERERELRVEVAGQFESYKVRVHSVLKQQKNNDTVIGISEHEAIV